jgi:hypothetical protein
MNVMNEELAAIGLSQGKPEVKRAGRVVAILPRGEAIRNFVYTGALDEVRRQADLTVVSVLPSPSLTDLLRERYRDVRELKSIREHRVVRIAREVLDMAHGRCMWSEAAKERWRLRDEEAVTPSAKVKRALKKALVIPLATQAGISLLTGTERTLSRHLRTTDEYLEEFRRLRPSLVFNASHVHSTDAIQAVQAAQWLGIPTATFLFSWDNLTSQGRILPLYDYYFAWNDAIRDDLLRLYPSISPDQVIVTGTPQFDFHFRKEFYWTREEFCQRVGADTTRPIVVYSTGMANHMSGEPDVVEEIADMLQEMPDLGRPQLLVRVYPKDRSGRFDELMNRRKDILFPKVPWVPAWLTPEPEDCYLLTNTLRHAAVGINVASTVSLELCMFDKPVVNVGYNPIDVPVEVPWERYYDYDHYRPVVESGAVTVAWTRDEMRALIRQSLVNPEQGRAQRRDFIQKMFADTLDGYSSHRLADQILSLASRGNE